jgi:ATP-dependent RNA helicase SUPV3L1/SUV3
LKPAARSLALLLWAEKQSNVDVSTLSSAQHLASSGRTSFPADNSLPRDAYRMLGYRQCGERAVRVDILERLADLIRPALAWRDNAPGTKPAGAFDGRGFVVTQAMTSLTGSAGEDFASVLRALGYRMDRRPPLPEKPVEKVETVSAETPPVEVVAQEVSGDASPVATLLPELNMGAAANDNAPPAPAVAEAPAAPEVEAVVEAVPVPDAVAEAAPAEAAVEVPAPEAPMETASAETSSAETAPAEVAAEPAPAETPAAEALATAAETPAEPALVEVWRPGGRHEERRPPRHDRNRNRDRHQRKADGAPAQTGDAVAAQPAGEGERSGEKTGEHRSRRDRQRNFRKPREGEPAGAPPEGAPQEKHEGKREERGDRGKRFEGKGKGRDERRDKSGDRGGRDRDKGGRRDRESGPALRQYATSANPRDNRTADPNSPFAKLAALKEQLARKD